MEDPAVAGLGKDPGPLQEHVQVLPPLHAEGQGGDAGIVACLPVDLGKELVYGHKVPVAPELFQKLQETGRLFPKGRFLSPGPGHVRKGRIEIPALRRFFFHAPVKLSPYEGQVVVAKAPCLTAEHRRQGDVLMGIVDDGEEGQHGLHLRGAEIAGGIFRIGWDPIVPQGVHQLLRRGPGGPQKDHHVPIPKGPKAPFSVGDHKGRFLPSQGDHLPDPSCNEPGLQLQLSAVILLFLLRQIKKQKLRPVAAGLSSLREGGSRIEGGFIRVLHASHMLLHDFEKYVVYAVKNLRSAAKVSVKLDLQVIFLLGNLRRIASVFVHEELRLCQTEAVDALLHIPHHKDIGPSEALSRQGLHQGLLDQIGVLILVDKDLMKMSCQLIRKLRGHHLPLLLPVQKPQGQVLHIAEVHQVLFPSSGLIAQRKGLHQIAELQKIGSRFPKLQQKGLLRQRSIALPEALDIGLHLVTDRLDLGLLLRVIFWAPDLL